MSSDNQTPTPRQLPRRTVAAGAVWAIPAVAISGAAPAYATSQTTLLPCIGEIAAVGGTYPVALDLSGCATDNSHWDFIFKIKAATKDGTDCDCDQLRVTVFDNPKRSRLWISDSSVAGNPSTNTNNSPRLYVQKTLAPGTTGTFPAAGDVVRRVVDTPYTGFTTGGSTVGTITAPGTADDSIHALITPSGGTPPCGASGPIAYYTVDCLSGGIWTRLGSQGPLGVGIGEINPCVPMIQATVCRFDTAGNDRYRLSISVLNSCGIPASNFQIKEIYRNDSDNFPNSGGNSVWTGTQALNAGVTTIDMNSAGNSGGHLWISFTTDGGVNTSRIRVPINNTACPAVAAQSDEAPAETLTTDSDVETTESTLSEPTASSVPETTEPSVSESASPEPTEQ